MWQRVCYLPEGANNLKARCAQSITRAVYFDDVYCFTRLSNSLLFSVMLRLCFALIFCFTGSCE